MSRNLIIFFVFILSFGACQTRVSNNVSVENLLNEMVDIESLAKISEFKTLQASSYSRKSINASEDGWFHNGDASQFERVDTIDGRIEHVLMDVEGPGAIVRFWSTWHAQKFSMGTLRFYFDHAEIAQIEGRIDSIISNNPNVGIPLSQTASPFLENGGWFSGHNLYFPLPYATHCKVTYQKADEAINDVLYYQINYREYAQGTLVKTYQKGDLESGRYTEAIKTVSGQLNDSVQIPIGLECANLKEVIKPKQSVSRILDGTKAIKQLSIKIDAENLEQALRSTVISMEFDGKQTVWVPLGDFFGTGYKISPYQSRYSQVTKDGEMNMWFPMPFRKSAKISLLNHGNQDVKIERMEIRTSDWSWDDRTLYFHANWRLYHDITTKEKQDVNFIKIYGTGKHVGDALTLYNGSYQWWGEGDEKIYVDGEKFPSHFGTGTEDYYGYAWCSVVNFSNPFHAQPTGEGNRSPGMTVNSRWRILDVVPFNSSYRFDMELWHWDPNITIDYAPTVFWYGTFESKAGYQKDIKQVKIPVKLSDKFEGENFEVIKVGGGEVITEAFLSYEWSARNHLLWNKVKTGDQLDAIFYSEKDRTGELQIVFTSAPEYATIDVVLNGKLILENINLQNEKLDRKVFRVENTGLIKGENEISLIVKETSKYKQGITKVGLDYLEIVDYNTKKRQ